MIVLIHRTYRVRRAGISRLLAATALAAVLAGCGSSGGSPSSGGGAASPGAQNQQSSGADFSGGGQSAAAGSVVQGGSGAVVSGAAGSIVQTKQPKLSTAAHGVTQGAGGSVLSPGEAQHASQPPTNSGASSTGSQGSGTSSKPATSSKSGTGKSGNTQPTHTTQAPPPPATTPPKTQVRTVTVTKTKTKIKLKTVVHVHTVIHTVTTNIAPKVPAAAFMPSKHPVLAQHSFLIAGGNVGCVFVGNGVRCAVQRRVWAAPIPPASCKNSWGDTIALLGGNPGNFVCGGSSPIVADAKVIPSGWDDKVGTVTCEVRSFGVDCFSAKNHGFIISRTGYTLY